MSYVNQTYWEKFIHYLKNTNNDPTCKWNHHKELIMRDDRSKRNLFLKQISQYKCDVNTSKYNNIIVAIDNDRRSLR